MQHDDLEIKLPRAGDIDSALDELGMLSSSTNSRREYLNEIKNRSLNMLINTKYVSNVSIGFRVRPVTPHVRYKPYKIPKERHRTKSENNDTDCGHLPSLAKAIVETCIDQSLGEISQLKKAKSLESIVAETSRCVDLKNINIGELEQVSHSIQNLKVGE